MTLELSKEPGGVLVGTRFFKASPEAVFDAHVDPDLIRQWMTGPEGWSMPVCESDVRPGGKIRFVWQQGDQSFSMSGEYIELDRPNRIVHTEAFEGAGDMPPTHCTTVFSPEGTGTRMTIRMSYASEEAMEAALASGMADGMESSYARIDTL